MRRSYNKEFKILAVKLVIEDNMPEEEVSRAMIVHYNSLYRRIGKYEKYGESAFPGYGTALYSYQYEIKNRIKKGARNSKKYHNVSKKLMFDYYILYHIIMF
ncbi:transposase [Clostridium saccharoperbutylacetonicum]